MSSLEDIAATHIHFEVNQKDFVADNVDEILEALAEFRDSTYRRQLYMEEDMAFMALFDTVCKIKADDEGLWFFSSTTFASEGEGQCTITCPKTGNRASISIGEFALDIMRITMSKSILDYPGGLNALLYECLRVQETGEYHAYEDKNIVRFWLLMYGVNHLVRFASENYDETCTYGASEPWFYVYDDGEVFCFDTWYGPYCCGAANDSVLPANKRAAIEEPGRSFKRLRMSEATTGRKRAMLENEEKTPFAKVRIL